MIKEEDLQANLINLFKGAGGDGTKAAHAYNTGVPDVMLLHSRLEKGSAYLEIKKMILSTNRVKAVPITGPQLSTLCRYTSFGVRCGIGIFFKFDKEETSWRFSLHPVRKILTPFNAVRVLPENVAKNWRSITRLKDDRFSFFDWMNQRLALHGYDTDCGLSYYVKQMSQAKKDKLIWNIK